MDLFGEMKQTVGESIDLTGAPCCQIPILWFFNSHVFHIFWYLHLHLLFCLILHYHCLSLFILCLSSLDLKYLNPEMLSDNFLLRNPNFLQSRSYENSWSNHDQSRSILMHHPIILIFLINHMVVSTVMGVPQYCSWMVMECHGNPWKSHGKYL